VSEKLIPWEVALDHNNKLQCDSPWHDAVTEAADVGNYFFYPKGRTDFIDIIVLARDKEHAAEVAAQKADEIRAAGKWGIDHI